MLYSRRSSTSAAHVVAASFVVTSTFQNRQQLNLFHSNLYGQSETLLRASACRLSGR